MPVRGHRPGHCWLGFVRFGDRFASRIGEIRPEFFKISQALLAQPSSVCTTYLESSEEGMYLHALGTEASAYYGKHFFVQGTDIS